MHIYDWSKIFVMTFVWWIVNEIKTSSTICRNWNRKKKKTRKMYLLSLVIKVSPSFWYNIERGRRVLSYSSYSRTVKYSCRYRHMSSSIWMDGRRAKFEIFCIYGIIHHWNNWTNHNLKWNRISKLRLNKKNRQHIACGDYRHNLRSDV